MLANSKGPAGSQSGTFRWGAQSDQTVPDAISGRVAQDRQPEGVPGRRERTAGRSPIPVIFWQQDGCCYEGATPNVAARKVLFIESKRGVSIGAEVTLQFTPSQAGSAEGNVLQGTVVWCCPSEDHFANRKGFGVCLTSGRLPVSLPAGSSQKEAV